MRRVTLYLTAIIILGACKKSINDIPHEPEPVFYVEYTINGEAKTIEAGKDAYYMYTTTEKDSFDVNQLIGRISPDQTDFRNTFEFKFRSNSPSSTNSDSVFKPGVKSLVDSSIALASNKKVKVEFRANKVANVSSYDWTVNGNLTSTSKSPEFIFDKTVQNDFPAELQTTFDTSCVAKTTRCVHFDFTDCDSDYEFTKTGPLSYHFKVSPQFESNVSNVIWYIKNIQASTDKEFKHTFSSPGLYQVSADIFTNDGCVSCLTKKIVVDAGSNSSGCFSDFTMKFSPFNAPEFLHLNKLEVNYWDDNGTFYTSTKHVNPGSIEILESRVYSNNEEGLETRIVKLRGIVRLANENGDELEVEFKEAYIAVGYTE